MAKTYVHTATVRGARSPHRRNSFPLDMLRRCACYPASEQDAADVGGTFEHADGEEQVTIELKALDTSRHKDWEPGRWASFGWSVVATDVRQVG